MLKVSQVKMTKMPLINHELTKGQKWSNSIKMTSFHVFISNLRLFELFVNFDQIWLRIDFYGNQELTFDAAI